MLTKQYRVCTVVRRPNDFIRVTTGIVCIFIMFTQNVHAIRGVYDVSVSDRIDLVG